MANKAGVAVLGGVALLLLAGFAGAKEKQAPKTEPKKPSGPQLPPGCVRTYPGEQNKLAVKAWQQCLIAQGCLAAGEDDGIHGDVTEQASRNWEQGKCDVPLKSKKAPPAATSRVYYLMRKTSTNPSVSKNLVVAKTATSLASVQPGFTDDAEKDVQGRISAGEVASAFVYYIQSSRTDDLTADLKTDTKFTVVVTGQS